MKLAVHGFLLLFASLSLSVSDVCGRWRSKHDRRGAVAEDYEYDNSNLKDWLHNLDSDFESLWEFDLEPPPFDWSFFSRLFKPCIPAKNSRPRLSPHVCHRLEERNETVDEQQVGFDYSQTTVNHRGVNSTTTISVVNGTKFFRRQVRECCHGYEMRRRGVCEKVKNMTGLLRTIESVGSKKMSEAIKAAGLSDFFQQSNYTILAPSDEAMKEFLAKEKDVWMPKKDILIIDGAMSDAMTTSARDVLKAHVIPGLVHTYDLQDSGIVETLTDGANIRVSVGNNRRRRSRSEVLLANCVEIIQGDKQSTNGIVHQVNKVLKPVTKTVAEIIAGDPQFSQMKTVLGRFGFSNLLKGTEGFTMFVPTNAAFEEVDPEILKSDERLKALLQNHIVPTMLCSQSFSHDCFKSLAGENLNVEKSRDGKIFVNAAQITFSDVMATDGVIHIIDGLLVPEQATDVLTIAQSLGLTDAVELIEKVGLARDFQELRNFTLFLPSNKAFESLNRRSLRLSDDDIRNMLLYHVITPRLAIGELRDGQTLDTLYTPSTVTAKTLRDSMLFPLHILLQCHSVIVSANNKAYGGLVHVIDKVLIPPKQTIFDILSSDRQFTTFVKLMKKAGMENTFKADGVYTVYAPTNFAFKKLRAKRLANVDSTELVNMMKSHIVDEMVCRCTTGVRSQGGTYLSSDGVTVMFDIRRLRGSARYAGSDMLATNGIIRPIEDVLMNQRDRRMRHFWHRAIPQRARHHMRDTMNHCRRIRE